MIEVIEAHDLCAINTKVVQLIFSRNRDRWEHRLAIGRGERRRVFCETVMEQTPPEPPLVPINPVFQEIRVSKANREVTALLLGSSGRHHYSASFRVREEHADAEGSTSWIAVDMADRGPRNLDPIGSSYQVQDRGSALIRRDPQLLEWRTAPGEPRIQIRLQERPSTSPLLPQPVLLAVPPGDASRDSNVHLVQILAAVGPELATHRWSYEWVFHQTALPT